MPYGERGARTGYDYVVFVRYLMGTAYPPSPLHGIYYQFFASIVPTPSFMFFLDVRPDEAYRRNRQTHKTLEMFESIEELKEIRHKALCLALMHNWIIVDANKPIKDVDKEIRKSL